MNGIYLKGLKILATWIFANRSPGTQPPAESTGATSAPARNPKMRGESTCIPCSIDHTATVCGVLNESVRFARREGVAGHEVQRRIAKAEEELNAMERLDLDAQAIAKLPGRQRELVGWLAVQSKGLRDRLKEIKDVSDLENVAADACQVRLEFRTKSLGLPEEVVHISKKVESGELSGQEAVAKIKELAASKKA